MTEKSSEKCECSKGDCCKSRSGSLLLSFMLLVIIVFLAGIFYSLQGMVVLSPGMKGSECYMMKGKMPFCPLDKVTHHPVQ